MKKIFLTLFLIVAFFPLKINAFDTGATSAILMDIDSHRILYSKNIHNRRSIASISNIMTI